LPDFLSKKANPQKKTPKTTANKIVKKKQNIPVKTVKKAKLTLPCTKPNLVDNLLPNNSNSLNFGRQCKKLFNRASGVGQKNPTLTPLKNF